MSLILTQLSEQSLFRSLSKQLITRLIRISFSNDHTPNEDKENKTKDPQNRKWFDKTPLPPSPLDKLELTSTFGEEVYAAKKDERPMYIPEEDEVDLTPPTNCCMSGCANCVWIEYVENLAKHYSNPQLSKEKVHKELEQMDDPSLKAFIILELKSRGLW